MDYEVERLNEIITLQSALDDRRPERRRTGIALVGLLPITLLLLAAGFVFGGHMWWFPALWTPVVGLGAYRWLRMVLSDHRDAARLQELDFDPSQ